MKKAMFLWLGLMVAMISCAQQKPKVKGNKLVSEIFNTLEDFNSIEISDNLVVHIMQTGNNGYHLKADGNLIDVVKFNVMDGVLKIYSTHHITSFKELEITLTFDEIDAITLFNDSKLVSKKRLEFKRWDLKAMDEATYDIEASARMANLNLHSSSEGKLRLNCDIVEVFMDQNAFLKGNIQADNITLRIRDRADIEIGGEVVKLKLDITGTSDVRARKLKSVYA
ncbi:GIN domain-containing protein [Flagellimonas lutaonensis]|uniref:Putative auto-transporter adhesin head GIN domain-containing protein n=1 Tax=Flagellimonas lutaonensis TaxID=516051 RepID=A0A0D5YSP6_9FLAO|nr:DUF2807 domain-containing protein [Allomuricauda lutaonensis]AKA35337.1 hypothetical protein VC82_1726 [Allomuricauda lutaonensis]